MRSSPRKRSGAATCSTPVEIFSLQQLLKIPIGELRHLAAEKHSIKNVALLKKPELLTKLREHFESRHGLQLTDEKTEEREEVVTQDVSPISQTIDRLRSRIKDKKGNTCEDSTHQPTTENLVGSADRLLELAHHVLTPSTVNTHSSHQAQEQQQQHEQQEQLNESLHRNHENNLDHHVEQNHHHDQQQLQPEHEQQQLQSPAHTEEVEMEVEVEQEQPHVEFVTETVIEDAGVHIVETTCSDQPQFDPSDVISEEVIGNSEETLYEEYITSDTVEVVDSTEVDSLVVQEDEVEDEDEQMVVGRVNEHHLVDSNSVSSSTHPLQTKYKFSQNKVCHGYVVVKTVKELRDLGRDMLRIHAENHGIDHASRLRMPELLKEVIEHYNGVHNAGLELTRLEMLKLNMLQLKKVKINIRDKSPTPDFSKLVPKNVVPLEEQVHHVYEKRPDVCTVDIIVSNLKDMLALGTSILRPEASKHRVANSSRKQKLQVVEELWEHYLKFHLKETESNEVVEEEYESDGTFQSFRSNQPGFIVVREEDIVQGEEIQAVAEEIAE